MSKPHLSIIIPCYKEAENLPKTFPIFEKFATSQGYSVELIFVEDGSPDNTLEILKKLTAGKKFCRVLDYGKNQGKGFAVQHGMLAAAGDFRLFADTDNATPIEQVNKLLAKIDSAQVAIGSRYIKGAHFGQKQPFYRILGARFLNLCFRILIGLKIKDTQCGFKLFTAQAAKEIFSRQTFARFSFDIEILAIAHYLGYKICEVPINWYARGKGTVSPVRDGLRFLKALILVRRNFKKGVYKKSNHKLTQV